MISLESVGKRYGSMKALDGLSLSVPAGHTVALWGHNGAGKSTTLKCILGLVSFTGQIRVAGIDVRRNPRAARTQIGYVPQELAHYDMTVASTVSFFATIKGVGQAQALSALRNVGLESELRKQACALSGGMRQRLSLALALLADPPVLLLDEPTANLDDAAREDLLDLLYRCKQSGKTMVFASHRSEEVSALADTVVVLDHGRIAGTWSPHGFAQRQAVKRQLRRRGEGGWR